MTQKQPNTIRVPNVPRPTAGRFKGACWKQWKTGPLGMMGPRCLKKRGHKGPHDWERKSPRDDAPPFTAKEVKSAIRTFDVGGNLADLDSANVLPMLHYLLHLMESRT